MLIWRILKVVKKGRSLCEKYKATVGDDPCFLAELDDIEAEIRQRHEDIKDRKSKERKQSIAYQREQLIDITRRDEAQRAKTILPWATIGSK